MVNQNLQLITLLLTGFQQIQDKHRLLTEDEAGNILGLSLRTLYRLRKNRQIDHVVIGEGRHGVRYTRKHIEDFITSREKPAKIKTLRRAA